MKPAIKKTYSTVSQMVRDMADDPSFADDFEKHLAQRRVVKKLMVLRAAQGLSQQDIAGMIGCTQSRISKLESATDSQIRLGDLEAYAAALGLEVKLVLTAKNSEVTSGNGSSNKQLPLRRKKAEMPITLQLGEGAHPENRVRKKKPLSAVS